MNDDKLFHYQTAAFQDLRQTAKAFFDPRWHEFPIKPRFSRLIVGPSGVGKTHIVRALAEQLDLPFFSIDVSNWILLGASAAGKNGETWEHISNFIAKNERGIIFLDELDKLGRTGDINDSAWTQHLRVEVYGLLDRRIPTGISLPSVEEKRAPSDAIDSILSAIRHNADTTQDKTDQLDVHLRSVADENGLPQFLFHYAKRSAVKELTIRLERNMLLLGAGAFQGLWENWSKPRIGLTRGEQEKGKELQLRELQTIIPTELANRFAATPVVMCPLQQQDYRQMLYRAACKLPKDIASHMVRTGLREIALAIESGLGVRWVESLLLRTLSRQNSLAEGAAGSPGLTCSPS